MKSPRNNSESIDSLKIIQTSSLKLNLIIVDIYFLRKDIRINLDF